MEIFFSTLIFLFVFLSPLILFYGLLNMQYELLDDKLVIKFFGLKFREIFYKEIKNIKSFEQFPFIKNQKWQNIAFNKAIFLDLNNTSKFSKQYYFTSKTIIIPKNRDEFFVKLNAKINEQNLKNQ